MYSCLRETVLSELAMYDAKFENFVPTWAPRLGFIPNMDLHLFKIVYCPPFSGKSHISKYVDDFIDADSMPEIIKYRQMREYPKSSPSYKREVEQTFGEYCIVRNAVMKKKGIDKTVLFGGNPRFLNYVEEKDFTPSAKDEPITLAIGVIPHFALTTFLYEKFGSDELFGTVWQFHLAAQDLKLKHAKIGIIKYYFDFLEMKFLSRQFSMRHLLQYRPPYNRAGYFANESFSPCDKFGVDEHHDKDDLWMSFNIEKLTKYDIVLTTSCVGKSYIVKNFRYDFELRDRSFSLLDADTILSVKQVYDQAGKNYGSTWYKDSSIDVKVSAEVFNAIRKCINSYSLDDRLTVLTAFNPGVLSLNNIKNVNICIAIVPESVIEMNALRRQKEGNGLQPTDPNILIESQRYLITSALSLKIPIYSLYHSICSYKDGKDVLLQLFGSDSTLLS